MAGYPKIYNIEMDPHEDLNVFGLFGWVGDPALEVVRRTKSVKEYPNPPAPNITQFRPRRLRYPMRGDGRLAASSLGARTVRGTAHSRRADEGGVSFWVPGQYGSFAAIAPSPGWSLPLVFYNYGGSKGAERVLPNGHLREP